MQDKQAAKRRAGAKATADSEADKKPAKQRKPAAKPASDDKPAKQPAKQKAGLAAAAAENLARQRRAPGGSKGGTAADGHSAAAPGIMKLADLAEQTEFFLVKVSRRSTGNENYTVVFNNSAAAEGP